MELMLGSRGPCGRNRRLQWIILTVWLSFWAHRTSAQVSVVPAVVTAAVGHNVTLHVQVSGTIRSYIWYRGAETNAGNQILIYYPGTAGPQANGAQHTGRETGLSNGSLHITNARMTDTGLYTVTVQTLVLSQASGQLRVYDRLSTPSLVIVSGSTVSGTNVTLRCQHGNPVVERYTFSKDNLMNPCAQSHITCSESSPSLYFHPLKESDIGIYTCTIFNPVSSSTSAALEIRSLPISDVTLTSNTTSGRLWANEDSVKLTCSSLGTEPTFLWSHDGRPLPRDPRYHLSSGNISLTISPVHRTDTGPFVCTASNSMNNQSSQPLYFSISWRPSGRMQCVAEASGVDQVLLLCSWPHGSPAATVVLLHPIVNGTDYHEVKGNISRSSIVRGTKMICYGSQGGFTQDCSLLFDLPHDPALEKNSTSTVPEGTDVSLEVNLRSRCQVSPMEPLPATFAWSDNSSASITPNDRLQITSNGSFSQLTISRAMEADSGSYLCRAVNLMGTTRFSFTVNITTGIPQTSKGLSAGAIAGIVVGVLAVLVLIGVTVFLVWKRNQGQRPKTAKINKAEIEGPQADMSPYSTVIGNSGKMPELEYVNVNNIPHKPAESHYEAIIPNKAEAEYMSLKTNLGKRVQ